jgi:hypothetical protein
MRKRGDSQSKGEAAPTSWPAGAWARLRIKRPVEHAAERYLFGNELSIGRATSLSDRDFRIDLKQVDPRHFLLFRASRRFILQSSGQWHPLQFTQGPGQESGHHHSQKVVLGGAWRTLAFSYRLTTFAAPQTLPKS